MSVNLEFQHPWTELFWNLGISVDDVPLEFYEKFGTVLYDVENYREALIWLFKNSNEAANSWQANIWKRAECRKKEIKNKVDDLPMEDIDNDMPALDPENKL